jgi:hypothetical protein
LIRDARSGSGINILDPQHCKLFLLKNLCPNFVDTVLGLFSRKLIQALYSFLVFYFSRPRFLFSYFKTTAKRQNRVVVENLKQFFLVTAREMENTSRGPISSGILSLSAQGGRCRTSQLQDYRVQEYRLPSPPSFKCNLLRESLFVDSQNIPCSTLERRGSWVISICHWVRY